VSSTPFPEIEIRIAEKAREIRRIYEKKNIEAAFIQAAREIVELQIIIQDAKIALGDLENIEKSSKIKMEVQHG